MASGGLAKVAAQGGGGMGRDPSKPLKASPWGGSFHVQAAKARGRRTQAQGRFVPAVPGLCRGCVGVVPPHRRADLRPKALGPDGKIVPFSRDLPAGGSRCRPRGKVEASTPQG